MPWARCRRSTRARTRGAATAGATRHVGKLMGRATAPTGEQHALGGALGQRREVQVPGLPGRRLDQSGRSLAGGQQQLEHGAAETALGRVAVGRDETRYGGA